MRLYTSYFDNIDFLNFMGYDNLVCVAGYAPKSYFDSGHRFYPELAPRKAWWQEWHDRKLSEDWYAKQYKDTVLSKLNPIEVANELGDGAVLLCYERPNEFCHRKLIANWFKEHGIEVEELDDIGTQLD